MYGLASGIHHTAELRRFGFRGQPQGGAAK